MSSDFQPIVPAAASFSIDGTLYSPQFDDIYASSQGTLAQSDSVRSHVNVQFWVCFRWTDTGAEDVEIVN